MKTQDYEFYEDFILLAGQVDDSDEVVSQVDIFSIMNDGSVKLNKNYEFYNYLKAKRSQRKPKFTIIRGGK